MLTPYTPREKPIRTMILCAALLFAPLVSFGESVEACKPVTAKEAENATFTTLQVACLIEKAFLPLPELEKACNVEPALEEAVKQIVNVYAAAAMRDFGAGEGDGGSFQKRLDRH